VDGTVSSTPDDLGPSLKPQGREGKVQKSLWKERGKKKGKGGTLLGEDWEENRGGEARRTLTKGKGVWGA